MKYPFVRTSSAVSLDGKISISYGVSSKNLSKLIPNKLFNILNAERNWSDGIMIGSKTVKIDNPTLTIRNSTTQPAIIIPDSKGVIPLNSSIYNQEKRKVIVGVSGRTPEKYVNALKEKDIDIIISGIYNANLKSFLLKLKQKGINKILLEGGGELITEMIKNNLVNELRVLKMPFLFAGKDAPIFFNTFKKNLVIKLNLVKVEKFGDFLYLIYKIK